MRQTVSRRWAITFVVAALAVALTGYTAFASAAGVRRDRYIAEAERSAGVADAYRTIERTIIEADNVSLRWQVSGDPRELERIQPTLGQTSDALAYLRAHGDEEDQVVAAELAAKLGPLAEALRSATVIGSSASQGGVAPDEVAILAGLARSCADKAAAGAARAQSDFRAANEAQIKFNLAVTAVAVLVGLAVAVSLHRAGLRERTLEAKQDEAERAEAQRRAAILASAPDAFVLINAAGVVAEANHVAGRMFGADPPELVGRPIGQLLESEEGAGCPLERLADAAGQTQPATGCRGLRLDGTAFPAEVSLGRMEMGGEVWFIAFVRDLTERRQVAERLNRSQKLEAVGRLAGGVAHDFNNIIMVIGGYLPYVRQALPPDSPALDDLVEIESATERAQSLSRQLLTFARRQPSEPSEIDANAVVAEVGRMLRRLLGEDLIFSLDLDEALWPVLIDRGQLEQVLMNLAVNARDAMPTGGSLTISTRNIDAASGVAGGPAGGQFVRIDVSDTGTGMTPDVLARVFEPFFTTKEHGKGTGLGLATCFGVAEQAGGSMTVRSTFGRGSMFTLWLPRSAKGAPAAEVRPALGLVTSLRQARVLVVEDEAQVRAVVARDLRTAGYEVETATSGLHALEIIDAKGPFDLVLTDLTMPNMGGNELADEARKRYPGMRILFLSGYPAGGPDGLNASGIPVVYKPVSRAVLLERVADQLEGLALARSDAA